MGHGGRVLHQGLGVAERDGDGAKLQLVESGGRGVAVGLEFDAHHAAGLFHLLFRDLIALEVLQAGVIDLVHRRVIVEELCDLHGVCAVLFHADVQGLEAAGDQEGIEGAQHGAGHVLQAEGTNFIDEVCLADHEARNHIAVAVEVLGGGVDDHIGAELQRLLEIRRGEGVVHDDPDGGVEAVGNGRNGGDVHHLQGGIAGGFEIDDFCLLRQSGFHGVQIGKVDEGRLHAELGHAVVHQREGAAVERVGGDDLITADNRGPERGRNRAHACGGAQRGFPAFQGGDLFLGDVHRGVGETGIDETRFLTGKASAAFLNGSKLKGGGLVDRRGQSTCRVLVFSGVNLFGGKSAFFKINHDTETPFRLCKWVG